MASVERVMSFTELCINEAAALTRKNQCCRRAFVYGVLTGAASFTDADTLILKIKTEALSELMTKLIKEQFGRECRVRKLGQRSDKYEMSFSSRSAHELVSCGADGFLNVMKCPSCTSSYLAGLLCSAVSINDPKKDFYLSLRVDISRSDTVKEALDNAGLEASYREMGKKAVFYMRQSSRIEDFLAMCGMQRMLFDFINQKIENEYRNNANRASNIEINNIKKAVDSAKKYTDAIRWLEENGGMGALDSELYETARLRVEYPEYSLSSLGAMMSPAVSKTGVLHRLRRIYEEYETQKKKKTDDV